MRTPYIPQYLSKQRKYLCLHIVLVGIFSQLGLQADLKGAEPTQPRVPKDAAVLLAPDELADALQMCRVADSVRKCRQALPQCDLAVKTVEAQYGSQHTVLARVLGMLAECQVQTQEDLASAEKNCQRALDIRIHVLGREHPDVAQSMMQLAAVLDKRGKSGDADEMVRRAQEIRRKLFGPEQPIIISDYQARADLLYKQGQYSSAEHELKQALKIAFDQRRSTKVAEIQYSLGSVLTAQGKYRDAEPLIRSALSIWEKELGSEHPEVARSLNNLGLLYSAQGKYAEAEALLRHANQILIAAFGREHPTVAVSLNNLAMILHAQGKYAEAESLYRQALLMQQKLQGAEHPDVAQNLDNLAQVLSSQGKYREAEGLFLQALSMREKLLGTEHPEVASTLNNLAAVFDKQGNYEKAEALYRRALWMRTKLLGQEHPNVATSLSNLAAVFENQGKYEVAETLYRQALVMRKKLLGTEHPHVATSLGNLASVLEDQGKYSEAEPLVRQALAMRQKLLGSEHPDTATSLNSLALLLNSQGRYREAETLFQQALRMRMKLLGAEHPDVATSLSNLALVLNSQGRFEEAETLDRRALAMREKLLGAEHPDVATSFSNLALVLNRQDRYEEAEALDRRALVMRVKLLGTEHPDVATSLSNLALVLNSQGKFGEAETLDRQALQMRQKLLGAEHPDVATSLNNLALVLNRQGRYEEASLLGRQALLMREKLLGAEHPDVATSLHNMSLVLLEQGQPAAAVARILQAARIRERQLRSTISQTRMRELLASLREEEELVYGLLLSAPTDPVLRQLALATALLRKGRAAETGASANRLLHRNLADPMLRQHFDQWQEVRQRREALLYGGLDSLNPAAYRAQLRQLQLQADSLEAQLSAALPQLKTIQLPGFDAIVSAVANRLPQKGTLVEVVWARPYQTQATGTGTRWGLPHYIALQLFPDRQIVSLDLGEAAVLDSRIRGMLTKLQNPVSDPNAAAQALYQQILRPLRPNLDRVSELYLSLDGTLNLVPFDALHDGTDYLLGRYHFHYLTSGRDLLRHSTHAPSQPALILANPDFGKPLTHSPGVRPLGLYQRFASLPRLPGTQIEAQQLAPLLGVVPLLGGQASEEAIRAAHGPWVLHIATHGFFDKGYDSPTTNERGISLLPSFPYGRENMGHALLVLAGAANGQLAPNSTHDGLLTDEEIRSLDLDGTQLVVLSACETGVGTVEVGQGVRGLRGDFLVAGAETVVSSLWRVNDAATINLMGLYYRKLLDRRHPGDRIEALQEAMRELRASPGRSHPYYWAPFIVTGEGGPLRPPP